MSNNRFRILPFKGILRFFSLATALALLVSYISVFVHPEKFWPLQFFGLLYPILLLLSFFFLIYFLLKKSRWLLLPLLTILLGGKLHFRYVNLGFGEKLKIENAQSSFKLMSYNVRLFDFYLSSEEGKNVNKNNILNYVNAQQPDVLCFQEFFYTQESENFNTKDTLLALLKTKNYHDRVKFQKNKKRNFGISLISKYPILSKGEVSFPGTSSNYCIYADINLGKDTVRVYNTHLQSVRIKNDDVNFDLDDDEQTNLLRLKTTVRKLKTAYPVRIKQSRLILKHAATSPFPVVICGDFNDAPMSYTYNLFNKNYTDAFRNSGFGFGRTYAGKLPAGRIDYIWHNKSIASDNFNIQSETYSDHHAISAKIILP